MKRSLLVALCATSVIYAGSFETWDAAKIFEDFYLNYQIHTGLGNGLETEGYWYSYNDNNNSGSSVIVWPVSTDLFYSNQSLDPVIEECKGLAGTAILSKESYEHDPYVGVGFNVVGETSETNPAPDIGDASAWGGLCVTYMSDTDIALELGLGETVDSTINYANPTVTLPAAKAPNILSPNGKYGNKVVVNWSDFKQPSWYDGAVKIDGETAAKQLAAVHFKIQAEPGEYNFNICAIGPKDGTCPEKCGKSTSAGPFITWNGADEYANDQVQTGLGNETETSGFWFSYGDDGDGGVSAVRWDTYTDPEPPHVLEPIVLECKGICGTAQLRKGILTYTPFIGLGFSVVGQISYEDFSYATGDASSWGGLCVTYTSDADIQLELGLGKATDSTINYANPAVNLPASKTSNRMVFSWSDFKQPSSYDGAVKIEGEAAAKQLAMVKFKIQAEDGDYRFNICAVGPKDGTCPEQCGTPSAGIQIAHGTSAVKAFLNGRTLGFTGIKSTATVEVLNSLGQVVMKGAINNAINNAATLNLTSLNAGIYMVRVSGKNVNFAKKIVLR
ncbi:T9SS type A sorting domain-containing protein [Fibrobacter sp. UWB13]|uniref:T9SS type A sorting domain-containing protein n=1 Tax=Fibrobacter sp. UWB13 TaxID=1896204 RepID=UPI000A0E86E1|nr:T9SS type A sorting domain-containing protein [Fibrobacter sp. UWB13]SMG15142.1 Por secretion system C-terminal sorting domain-containing protein [Fibrobacter sp. UWB13]